VLGTTAETAEIADTVLDGPESQGVEVGILPDVKVRRRPRRVVFQDHSARGFSETSRHPSGLVSSSLRPRRHREQVLSGVTG
jgi:hypothetical protein